MIKRLAIVLIIVAVIILLFSHGRISLYLAGFHPPYSYITTKVVNSTQMDAEKYKGDNNLILPKSAFRKLGDKEYGCIITDRRDMPGLHVDYIPKAIKYNLVEVSTGPKSYYGDIWTEVRGLSLGHEVVLTKVDLKDPNNPKIPFQCGEIRF